MSFNTKYNIYAEAKAVLGRKSPLQTFTPYDIGTFVLAWSGTNATAAIRGTLLSFGCDSRGEYAIVKPWLSENAVRYTLVAPLPAELLPTVEHTVERVLNRDPDVNAPGM